MGNGKAKLRDNKTHERSIKNETKKNKRKHKIRETQLKSDNKKTKLKANKQKSNMKSKGVNENEIPNYVEEWDYFRGLSVTESMTSMHQKSINKSVDPGIDNLADYLQQKQCKKVIISDNNLFDNASNVDDDTEYNLNDLMIRKGTSNYSVGGQSFSNAYLAKSDHLTPDKIDRLKKLESIDVNNTLECTICASELEPNQKIGKLACGHYFHKKCVYKWLKQNPTCPICRSNCVKFSSWL